MRQCVRECVSVSVCVCVCAWGTEPGAEKHIRHGLQLMAAPRVPAFETPAIGSVPRSGPGYCYDLALLPYIHKGF